MGTYPALNIQPPQQVDLLGNLGKLMGYRAAQQQLQSGQLENQQHQLQIQQMQSDIDSQKAFTRAYQESQGDPQATVQKALQYGAKPQFVDGWLKSRAELDKVTEEAHEKHLKNLSDGYGLIGQQAQAILTLPPEQRGQAIQQAVGNMVQSKGIEPGYAQQLLQSVPQDPEGQQTWLQYHALSAMSAKDQVDLKLNQRKTAAEEMTAQTGASRLQAEMPGGPLEPGRVTPAMRYQQGQENQRLNYTQSQENARAANKKSDAATADEKKRADLAQNLNENLDALEEIVTRRPDLFGPVAGRWTSAKAWLGNSDKDIGALQTISHQLGMVQQSTHGMRSAHGVQAAADSILNNFKNSPEALKGAIKAARSSSATFLSNANPGVAGQQPQQAAAPGVSNIHVNPQTGEKIGWNGKAWVRLQ